MSPRIRSAQGMRRSAIAVEAERRSTERRSYIGGQLKAMRRRRKWSQIEMGRRADVGPQIVGRAERGKGRLTIEVLDRLAVALDAPLVVRFDRDPREDIADAGHLALQEVVLQLGRRTGALTSIELPSRPNEPWRSIDVVLSYERERRLVVVECWNTFGDVGAAVRTSRRKLREAADAAIARWGRAARADLIWVVRDSARNRELVRRYPASFAAMFSGSSHAWAAALTSGSMPPDEPGLVWCVPASGRVHAWRRVQSADG